ncbi:MAG: FecR family protein [Mariprofundaceae bacterium]
MIRFILIAISILGASVDSVASAVGKVVDSEGDVTILRASESIKAPVGAMVYPKDLIQTGDKSKARIKLDGGDVVSLGYKSKFQIEEYQLDPNKEILVAKFKALVGRFMFAVDKLRNPDAYSIRTKTAILGVRGTKWLTRVSDDETKVAGLEGLVSVSSHGKTKVVAKGESVVSTALGVGVVVATPAIFIELLLQEGITLAAASSGTVAVTTVAASSAGISGTAVVGGIAAASGVAAVAASGGSDNKSTEVPSSQPIEKVLEISLSPPSPAPLQNVTATCDVGTEGITVEYNVIATDGYVNSGTLVSNLSKTVSWAIPGASPGVSSVATCHVAAWNMSKDITFTY